MQIHLLGDLEVLTDNGSAALGPRKQRAVFAILAMHRGEIVPTDRLIDLLWGDDPPRTAAHSIQIYVSELRKVLDPAVIVTREPGYQLQAPPESIDVFEFERLVTEATQQLESGDRAEAAANLRHALRLWRGPALSDFVYEEFAQGYIERLHEVHLAAIEELAALELERGRPAEATTMLEAAVREDPLRERSRELLMLGLYRSGRHAEALRSYARFKEQLDAELGVDPSPQLQQLHASLLLNDPALDLVSAGDSVGAQGSATHQGNSTRRNPYKGLRPFTEADASDFHGRDALIQQLLGAIESGRRLVALVGPSGSGKSSVLNAGLATRLRDGAISGSASWLVIAAPPGTRSLDDISTIPPGQKVVLLIDQFEELFTLADDVQRRRFIGKLAGALERNEGRLVVVVSLRADFYDRPLLHPELAELFTAGVINVVPMTPAELEEAITAPAKAAGAGVESGLLADLVSEVADRPAALPMLQFALSEMFDQRIGDDLTRAGYRMLGGLTGILSRRADEVFATLEPVVQDVAEQVFLRLVRIGRDGQESRRRVAVAELADLDLDPVALSEILDKFGRHRLLSFDRDAATGSPTVEVAHDAFLRGWDRLAGWIDRHRTALVRRDSLVAALDEWEGSGRLDDYLLAGARLDEFTPLLTQGSLELTGRERDFLVACVEHKREDEEREAARVADRHRLEASARRRLVALAGVVALLALTFAFGAVLLPRFQPAHVGLVTPGPGALNDLIAAGFRRAVGDFGFVSTEWPTGHQLTPDDLETASVQGASPIVAWSMDQALATDVAKGNPNTRYILLEMNGDAPNATYVTFADSQGAYLAGAIAALKTRTGVIGFIGGVDLWQINDFEMGFKAGAHHIAPNIPVLTTYLSEWPDLRGFNDASLAQESATQLYGAGADIIFHAAGSSGAGLFQAATDQSNVLGRQLWAIGVDSDQYETIGETEGHANQLAWQPHILTSVLKLWDTVLYDELRAFSRGELTVGEHLHGLPQHAVDISYSGGFIDDIRPQVEQLKSDIADGTIQVPCAEHVSCMQ